LINNY